MVFNATFNDNIFSYTVAVSFIGGGNQSTRRKQPTCHKSLTNLSHNVVSRTPRLGRIQTDNVSGTPSNQFNLSIILIDTKNDNETNDFKSKYDLCTVPFYILLNKNTLKKTHNISGD